MLVDIGGGTTDVLIFRTGSPWYTAVIPVGGNQLTRDLSVALGVPSYIGEELKIRWGHALPEAVADEEVQIPGFQGEPQRTVERRTLCEPLHERFAETLKLVLQKVRQAGLRQLPPGGLVLTGGSAEMPGLQELVSKTTGAPTRIAYPRGIPRVAFPPEKTRLLSRRGDASLGDQTPGARNGHTRTVRGPLRHPRHWHDYSKQGG